MISSISSRSRGFSISATLATASPPLMKLVPADVLRPSMTLNDLPVESFTGRWAVALVKSREEKSCAEYLAALDVPYFLPLKVSRDRYKRKVWRALFPSYLFFCEADGESRYSVLDSGFCISSNAVTSVLSCVRQQMFRDDLIRIHHQQLTKPEMIDTYKPGTPIRVKSGPWMGREGFIEADSGKPIIIFRSEFMGDSSTPFEVDRECVELI